MAIPIGLIYVRKNQRLDILVSNYSVSNYLEVDTRKTSSGQKTIGLRHAKDWMMLGVKS
jgi:hypothetical protein